MGHTRGPRRRRVGVAAVQSPVDDRLHEDQRGLHTIVNKRVLLIHTASPGSSNESSNGDLSTDACATAYFPGVGAGGGPTSPVTGLPSPGAGSASKLKPEDARCGVGDGNLGEGMGEARGDARGDDSSSTIIASKSACSSSSPSNEGRGDTLGDTRGDVPGPHASKRAPRWWSSVRGEVTFFFFGDERFFAGG